MFDTTKIVCRPCCVCGRQATVEVLTADLAAYRAGALAQEAFPEMPAEDREMIATGTHPACWDTLFTDEDDR